MRDEDIPEVPLCKEDQRTVVIEVKQHTLFPVAHFALCMHSKANGVCMSPRAKGLTCSSTRVLLATAVASTTLTLATTHVSIPTSTATLTYSALVEGKVINKVSLRNKSSLLLPQL